MPADKPKVTPGRALASREPAKGGGCIRPVAALVVPEPPFPEDSGNALRDSQQMELLDRLGYEVALICVRPRLAARRPAGRVESEQQRKAAAIFLSPQPLRERETWGRSIHRKLSYLQPGNRRHPFGWWLGFYAVPSTLPALLQRMQPSVLIVRSIFIEYLEAIREVFIGPLIVDFHDDDSHLAREMVRSVPLTRKLGPWTNAVGVASALRHGMPFADEVWAVSEGDAKGLRRFSGGRPVLVVPSGVDERQIVPVAVPGRNGTCALVANFGYGPNFNGARWFVESVWSRVRVALPNAECVLIGGGREDEVRGLAAGTEGVSVTGRVPDLAPAYRDAGVFLAPLLQGGGTRLKVVEAWKHGKAVAGTSKGLEGLVSPGDGFTVSDDAGTLAAELVSLLRSPEARRASGEEGLRVVREKYGWNLIVAGLARGSLIGGLRS